MSGRGLPGRDDEPTRDVIFGPLEPEATTPAFSPPLPSFLPPSPPLMPGVDVRSDADDDLPRFRRPGEFSVIDLTGDGPPMVLEGLPWTDGSAPALPAAGESSAPSENQSTDSAPGPRRIISRHDSTRRRVGLAVRIGLPIILLTLAAAGLVISARQDSVSTGSTASALSALRATDRDNIAVEGTLLRARRDVEQTVGIDSPTTAQIQKAIANMAVRRQELARYRERIQTSKIATPLRRSGAAAYDNDDEYVASSVSLLELALQDPADAQAQMADNLGQLDRSVEAHRKFGVQLDDRIDTAAQALNDSSSGSNRLLLAALGLGVLGLAAIWWALRSVNRPLAQIESAVDSIAAGELSARTRLSGKDSIGTLAGSVDHMAENLTAAFAQLEEDARRGSQNRVVFEALDIADSEAEVHRVAEQAMGLFAPEIPSELLLSEANGGRLWRIASSPTAGAPGCTVESPASCFALRRGQTVIFESSESINSCPKLRNRPDGNCSAVCIPVSFAGQALGVLHTTGPNNHPPAQPTVDQLVDLASQLGARIGTLRTLESTRQQAATDGLTGLPNRRMIESRLAELIGDRVEFVFILADLDRFKSINDRFGHEVGDRALQLFARTLQDNVRDADLVARYGGEEFVIVYPEMTVGGSMEAIERMRMALATAQGNSSVPGFTCSFGVTHSSVGPDFEAIFRVADAGLLVAKELGRNRAIYADRELADRVFGGEGDRNGPKTEPVDAVETPVTIDETDWTTTDLTDLPSIPDHPDRVDRVERVGRLRRRDLGGDPGPGAAGPKGPIGPDSGPVR